MSIESSAGKKEGNTRKYAKERDLAEVFYKVLPDLLKLLFKVAEHWGIFTP